MLFNEEVGRNSLGRNMSDALHPGRAAYHGDEIDRLTGLPGRRKWHGEASSPLKKTGEPLSLFLIDIDHLSSINEGHGPTSGDFVIDGLAVFLRSHLGEKCSLYRYGGDCFLALFRGIMEQEAYSWADSLLKEMAEYRIELPDVDEPLHLSVSIGFVHSGEGGAPLSELVLKAGEALHLAKKSGRRQLCQEFPEKAPLPSEGYLCRFFPSRRYFKKGDTLEKLISWVSDWSNTSHLFTFLTGPPGSGKTRHLRELEGALASSGETSLIMELTHAGALQPFTAVLAALRVFFKKFPDLVAPAAGSLQSEQVEELLPFIAEFLPFRHDKPARHLTPREKQTALLEALVSILEVCTQRMRLVMIFDDLQHVDIGTIKLLDHLYRLTEKGKIKVAVTVEQGSLLEGNMALKDFMERRSERGDSLFLSLDALNEKEADGFISLILPALKGREQLVPLVWKASKGIPLSIEETLKFFLMRGYFHLEGEGLCAGDIPREVVPLTVSEAVLRRTEYLGHECRALLSKAAVIGNNFDIDMLEKLTGMEYITFVENLDKAVAASVLREKETFGTYAFVHDLVRQALYGELPDDDRRKFHHTLGTFLESEEDSHGKLAGLAYHFEQSGNIEKSLEYINTLAQVYEGFITPQALNVYIGRMPQLKDWGTEKELTAEEESDALKAFAMVGLSFGNIRNYSVESVVTQTTLDAGFSMLDKVLTTVGCIGLSFAEEQVILNGKELMTAGENLKELREAFHGHRINGIVLKPGVDRQQFQDFSTLLTLPHDAVVSSGGWSPALKKHRVTHIVVNEKIMVAVGEKDIFDPAKLVDAHSVAIRDSLSALADTEPPDLSPGGLFDKLEGELEKVKLDKAAHGAVLGRIDRLTSLLAGFRDMAYREPEKLREAHSPGEGMPLFFDEKAAPQDETASAWEQVAHRIGKQEINRILSLMRSIDISLLEYLQQTPPFLLAELESDDRSRVTAAAMGLWNTGSEAAGWLVGYLATSDNARGRIIASYLLKKMRPDFAGPVLIRLMETPSPDEKARLLEVLSDSDVPEVNHVLAALLNHPLQDIRRSVHRYLIRAKLEGKVDILRSVLQKGEPAAASDAALCLGALGAKEALHDLMKVLQRKWQKSSDELIALEREACVALGRIGDPSAVPLLSGVLIEGTAAHFMGKRDPSVRAAAAWALSYFAPDKVKDLLERASREPHPVISSAAKLAYERLAMPVEERKKKEQPFAEDEFRSLLDGVEKKEGLTAGSTEGLEGSGGAKEVSS
ncbi:MAG: diguanylate cyclase [Candidatus Eremiobacteraeota bacterium]|nr:diguanylate cyclase [Candidatus Eremiobacteraeota bacterium]